MDADFEKPELSENLQDRVKKAVIGFLAGLALSLITNAVQWIFATETAQTFFTFFFHDANNVVTPILTAVFAQMWTSKGAKF